jgi:hypothetical protein
MAARGSASGQHDAARFEREIAPKLDGFSLKEIGEAKGLSLAACSRTRSDAKVRIQARDALFAFTA